MQPLGQPVDYRTGSRRHLIRDEPKPRKRAQLDRQAQAIGRITAATWTDKRHVSAADMKKTDQLIAIDAMERSQLLENQRTTKLPPATSGTTLPANGTGAGPATATSSLWREVSHTRFVFGASTTDTPLRSALQRHVVRHSGDRGRRH